MIRRFLILGNALLMGTLLAATAAGQSSSDGQSLAERMAAARRRPATTTPGKNQTTANARRLPTAAQQSESRSLLPNWFGGGGEQQQQQEQTVAEPRAGSAQAAPMRQTSNATLPGLGGSRLPEGKWTPSRNRAAGRPDVSRELSSDYPVIREVTPAPSTNLRQRAGTSQSAAAGSATRHSPSRHQSPQITPDEMRRELSGSFSTGGSGPTARTARTNDSIAPSEEPNDIPLALPPIDNAPPIAGNSEPQPLKLERTESQSTPSDSSAQSAAEAFGATPNQRGPFGPTSFTRSPRVNATPTIPVNNDHGREAFGEALQVANGGDPSVLVSNQAPIITADIRGPQQIMVGREAVYRVRLQNEGAAAAEGIVATIRIPSWADVEGTVATQGTVQPSQNGATQLEWQIARIDGRTSETLDVRLVPRESRPLELGINWTVAPVGSRAIVEVQEPKLAIDVDGPNEVFFGKPQVFKLTLSNPGTGAAENVKIELVPPGAATQAPTSHPLGDLQPGESKTVEIELTAREAGKLQIKAIASADGGLTSDMAKEIFCRKPELEVDWRGPATQYAGTAATYFFRVRNPGTAPAEDVTVEVTLPDGAEFTSASDGQSYDPQRRQVTWRVGTLNPGDDNYLEVKCVVKKPGTNQFMFAAASAFGDLTDNATAETNVIALADLKLEVTDPNGAVAVGSPAVYEIRIANRGASAAKDVTVVALFSQGIEPDQAEGAMYTVSDGRVAFQPIDELAAGREITLRIRAHAVQPGTHVFRAEVLCSDAEIKLAAEETTRFYSDDVAEEADQSQQQSATRTGFEATVR